MVPAKAPSRVAVSTLESVTLPGRCGAMLARPKSEDLHPPVLGQHDAAGLEISVGDRPRVGAGEGVGQLDRDRQEPRERQARPADDVAQPPTLHELHADGRPARLLLDGMERDDVGVVERAHGPGLLMKAAQARRVAATSRGRNSRATIRPSRLSRARYTSPMPPAPTFSRTS
jgi:hypothetical protein